ncbi:DNA polymerase [Vibrio phage K482 g1]
MAMRHIVFAEKDKYKVAILIKEQALRKDKIEKHYLKYLEAGGIAKEDVVMFSLPYDTPKKVKAATGKEYLNSQLLPVLKTLGVSTILCADPSYFKFLSKKATTEKEHGYHNTTQLKDWEDAFDLFLLPNHQAVFHDPRVQERIEFDLQAMIDFHHGQYKELGQDVVKDYKSYTHYDEIKVFLDSLYSKPELYVDVETFGLKHYFAGLGTIGFGWDEHSAHTIVVDKGSNNRAANFEEQKYCVIRKMLREFFENYKGKLVFHNASFDIKIIIFNLWMDHLIDQEGLIKGLNIMTRDFDDTKVIAYLATNSTAGNKLGLKDQSHEFAGNYAESDIDDISKIPTEDLARYNAVDCMCTAYVKKKWFQQMVDDKQEKIYREVMLPSLKVIIQMELTGACLDMDRVVQATRKVRRNLKWFEQIVLSHPAVQSTINYKKTVQLIADNEKLKKHVRTMQELDHIGFNPASPKDIQILLHEVLKYDVHDRTDTKQPATGAKTLKKHMGISCNDEKEKRLMKALCHISDASIILNNFLKNFADAVYCKEDGAYYLFGNFNLGGTVSGRLSSSQPNMQNIPSTGTPYAKMIKKCFIAPPGFIFVGADFASLEDRISALTTRDPMKLKVYTDGYDGHCLRAYHYFPEQYVGIEETPESINATAKTHKSWRQMSKTPTFALTYGGTFMAIVEQTGMPVAEAKRIEANYHKLYKASDDWVQRHVENASKTGYVECAFGLRVRTPILAQTILNTSVTPYEAQKEARTAGNALGQSWGLLNNRAAIELQENVLASRHSLDIRPSMHIHDAQYFYVRDDIEAVKFLNDNLGQAMRWQNDPLIQHPDVPLFGELDIFHPHWGEDTTIPNFASEEEIFNIADSM